MPSNSGKWRFSLRSPWKMWCSDGHLISWPRDHLQFNADHFNVQPPRGIVQAEISQLARDLAKDLKEREFLASILPRNGEKDGSDWSDVSKTCFLERSLKDDCSTCTLYYVDDRYDTRTSTDSRCLQHFIWRRNSHSLLIFFEAASYHLVTCRRNLKGKRKRKPFQYQRRFERSRRGVTEWRRMGWEMNHF